MSKKYIADKIEVANGGIIVVGMSDNGIDAGQFNGTVCGDPATLSNQFVTKAQLPTSGTFTPTLTNTANISLSTLINATYIIINNIITVSIGFEATPTASGTNSQLNISLPVNRSGSSLVYLGSGTIKDTITASPLSVSVFSTSTTTVAIATSFATTNKFAGNIIFQYSL